MITLFIDTSSSDVSIAILRDNKIISHITKNIPNKHSVYTVSFLEKMLMDANLTPKEIEKIMVVTGPGSFTGLRIGVTIAKVYAYLEKLEITAISSLKMRALSVDHAYCLSLIDAHHGNYYLGLYDQNHEEVVPEQFCTKEKVLELIRKYQPVIVCDEELEIDEYHGKKVLLNISNIVSYYQTKETLNPHFVVPNYLKLPQALEKKHD